jgi:hypothetical protein
MLENFLRDLRIGVRTLFRSPGFSIIAVLVMALCMGPRRHCSTLLVVAALACLVPAWRASRIDPMEASSHL